jgi:integrase
MLRVSDRKRAADRVSRLPPGDVTVGLWLVAWPVFFPVERTEETERHDESMLGPFIAMHGPKLLSAVTPLMAQQWAVRYPAQVKYLRRVWEKAVAMNLVPYNVWKVVELPPRSKAPRSVPSIEQLDRMLARARERGEAGRTWETRWWVEFADLVEVTAFTGARQGGIISLRRSAVDLRARRVILKEKGQKTRRVVLAGRSLDAMRSALGRHRMRKLVFESRLRRPLTRATVGLAWREIRGDFDGPFHSLKHFAGTWLAAQGVDERDIAIQLGHTDSEGRPYVHLVRRVYVHPDHDEALDRIERTINEREAA